jgi:hypothetical protein
MNDFNVGIKTNFFSLVYLIYFKSVIDTFSSVHYVHTVNIQTTHGQVIHIFFLIYFLNMQWNPRREYILNGNELFVHFAPLRASV